MISTPTSFSIGCAIRATKDGAPKFLPIEVMPDRLLNAPDLVERIDVVIELGEDARIRCSDESSLIAAIRALRKAA